MKFLSASEILQRADKDIVERDTRDMETLIQARRNMQQEFSDIFDRVNPIIFGHMSNDWFFFDQSVFIVSLIFLQSQQMIKLHCYLP